MSKIRQDYGYRYDPAYDRDRAYVAATNTTPPSKRKPKWKPKLRFAPILAIRNGEEVKVGEYFFPENYRNRRDRRRQDAQARQARRRRWRRSRH